jgi:ATP-binding cassette, subfamily B, multidrug efflux pump
MLRLLRSYLQPYQGRIAVVLALLLVQALGNLYLPSLNADIIDSGVLKGDTGYITTTGAAMLGVVVVLALCAAAGAYLAAGIAMGFGRDVRDGLYRTIQGFSLRELTRFGAPSLITRSTNDVQQVQTLVLMGLNIMVTAPITVIGGVVMATRQNVKLSGTLLVIVPVMMVVIALVMRRAIPLFRSVQAKIDTINRILRENLTGIRVVRAFVRTDYEQQRFAAANADLTDTTLTVTRLFAVTMPVLMLVMNCSSVAIVWYGGILVNDGQLQIGTLTAFMSYMMQILFAVLTAVMMVVMVPRAAASSERIQAVLDTEPAIHDRPEGQARAQVVEPGPVGPTRASQSAEPVPAVEFVDVRFGYPGAQEPVLHGIDLRILAGQTTAVVGSTGSGKTTLVNLVPRLYDVTGGSVRVGGVDVRDQVLDDLWLQLGVVPQRAFLFTGTVADNLRYGRPDATDDELWAALEVAQARDVVEQLADGLQSVVEQGGANLSGGQRQRLAIARALVRRPAVYLFDDSFSALDYGTDARLRQALRPWTAGAAVVIVAQRISTILDADTIVVLDAGTVVGTGRHDELLTTCETYREIVASQLAAAGVA